MLTRWREGRKENDFYEEDEVGKQKTQLEKNVSRTSGSM